MVPIWIALLIAHQQNLVSFNFIVSIKNAKAKRVLVKREELEDNIFAYLIFGEIASSQQKKNPVSKKTDFEDWRFASG